MLSVHGRKWAIRVRWSTTISTRSKPLLTGKCVKYSGPKCVPRSRWNKQVVRSRSHLRLNLCSSIHDAALTKFFHILANSFPPESVERFSKSASSSFVINLRFVVQLCDQSQSELRVLWNSKAIETPKVPISGFYPAVFGPLTLVPIKRVLGVPLANKINELKAQLQRINCH
jgi:hypothetical protein